MNPDGTGEGGCRKAPERVGGAIQPLWTMKTVYLLVATLSILASCKGDKGEPGETGPQGNANIGWYQFSISLSGYTHYSSTDVWTRKAPSSFPRLQANQLALVYIWMDPISNSTEWVQQPYVHYFNGGTTFNEFFHGIESDGDLWLYIRNSTSGQPFTNMNSGSLSYKVFVIESSMQQEMESAGVNQRDMERVLDYFQHRGYILEAR